MNSSPARPRVPLDVFRYMDYRSFLADFYAAHKPRGLSYRSFARRAQLGAPNYLKLVIDGERNLTPGMAARFAEACGLTGEAEQYFRELVGFCQVRGAAAKVEHHQRLLSHRRYREAHKLESLHAEYHSAWYLPAIRELVTSRDFNEDPSWIAHKLQPPIKPSEAKQAISTLVKLGLLDRDAEGRLRQTSAVVTTGAETQGMHIATYHAEMAKRAVAAIDLVAAAERDISSITVCVGPRGLSELKRRMRELRRELLEYTESCQERCQVVQLNLQLFPLSKAELKTTPRARTRGRKSDEQA